MIPSSRVSVSGGFCAKRPKDSLKREGLSASLHIPGFWAGSIATELGECDRAIRWLETATRMQPELVPAFIALGECRAKVGDFVGAELALDRAAEIAPDLQALATARDLVAELESQQP